MKSIPHRLLLSIPAVLALACGVFEPPPENPSRLTLRATFGDGEPIPEVSVQLDGEDAGETDAEGRLLLDAPPGIHLLALSLDAGNGREARGEQRVEMGIGAQAVTVKLPKPVLLTANDVTTFRIPLEWEPGAGPGFGGYKVYMSRTDSAFDERTGQLIYQSPSGRLNQYVVTDSPAEHQNRLVIANSDYFFRVVVSHENGFLARSNILHVKTPAWDNAGQFTRFYELTVERQFAGTQNINGVAYDGDALWLLYHEDVGDYYQNDINTLVRINPLTRQVLSQISFEEHAIPVGLTWDGTSLWVGFFSGHVSRFNPSTGALEASFRTSSVDDLTWTGQELVFSDGASFSNLKRLDPLSGSVSEGIANPFLQYGMGRCSVAYRPGEYWLAEWWRPGIVIVDDAGVHVGVVDNDKHFRSMTFMNDKLVGVTSDSQVYIMAIKE